MTKEQLLKAKELADIISKIIQNRIDKKENINSMERKFICSHRANVNCEDPVFGESYKFRLKNIAKNYKSKGII